jgi:hypothetical protein
MKPKRLITHFKWVLTLGLIALIGSCMEQEFEIDSLAKVD